MFFSGFLLFQVHSGGVFSFSIEICVLPSFMVVDGVLIAHISVKCISQNEVLPCISGHYAVT